MVSFVILPGLLFILCSILHTSTACCGDRDWHHHGGQCFKFVLIRTSWPGARGKCQGMGADADLAQPGDITSFWNFMQTIQEPGGSPGKVWQIGAQTDFKWLTRGGIINQQPEDHCVVLTWRRDGTPILRASPCSDGWSYICGRPMDSGTACESGVGAFIDRSTRRRPVRPTRPRPVNPFA